MSTARKSPKNTTPGTSARSAAYSDDSTMDQISDEILLSLQLPGDIISSATTVTSLNPRITSDTEISITDILDGVHINEGDTQIGITLKEHRTLELITEFVSESCEDGDEGDDNEDENNLFELSDSNGEQ